MSPAYETLLETRAFLNFQSQQSSVQRVIPSACGGGYGVFLRRILNSDFFGIAGRAGVEGGMWWKSLGLLGVKAQC